ncbi:MAG: DUF2779 domain-containing protein [Actinobacteria bacterium]|nr:DUF2779 domain-containing protein [Actinomycetota bacterium]
MDKIISKSKYIAGLQCLKYLWYLINEPDVIPPFDEVIQFRFQQGHDVGNLAKSLFPGGIEIEHGVDIEAELARARELTGLTTITTSPRLPFFEAAFTYKNSFARADILEPTANGSWNIIEVKSASSIKDINIHDVSFQKYCYEGAGLKINRCYLMYLNKDFIKYGPIDLHKFFVMEDVTIQAEILQDSVEDNINQMLDAVESSTCPDISIGKNCYNPYECQMKQVCWSDLPKNNVFELYRGKDLACYFYQNGITQISHINETSMLDTIQVKQYKSVTQNCAIIDRDNIRFFLNKLKYPLYFLDFETFATAIPLFDGLRPYQNIPFQFSHHILQGPEDILKSLNFLAEDNGKDPRKDFLESLKKALGYDSETSDVSITSSILVYYEYFEKNILEKLAEAFPEHAWWIEDTARRIVDLYEPFGKFYYYSSDQKGSASLKNVLPALTGISYDDMEIKNGQEASIRYLNITFLKGKVQPGEALVVKIRKDLLDYCGLDTEGMIYILRELYKIAEWK